MLSASLSRARERGVGAGEGRRVCVYVFKMYVLCVSALKR